MSVERSVFKTRRYECPVCHTRHEALKWNYERVRCGHCADHPEMHETYGGAAAAPAVIDDSIPGGVEIRHGLCNPDGSPRRYDSKSEIARDAKALGLINWVEHKPEQGSDKSPHTSRWV